MSKLTSAPNVAVLTLLVIAIIAGPVTAQAVTDHIVIRDVSSSLAANASGTVDSLGDVFDDDFVDASTSTPNQDFEEAMAFASIALIDPANMHNFAHADSGTYRYWERQVPNQIIFFGESTQIANAGGLGFSEAFSSMGDSFFIENTGPNGHAEFSGFIDLASAQTPGGSTGGGASVQIFTTPGNLELGSLFVNTFNGDNNGTTPVFFSFPWNGGNGIRVHTGAGGDAISGGGEASFIASYDFTLTFTPVPLPTGIILLGSVLPMLIGSMKRRSPAAQRLRC